MKKLGYILTKSKLKFTVIVPYHTFHYKYKKIQIKLKKYYILDLRKELKKGDIILFNISDKKILKILN